MKWILIIVLITLFAGCIGTSEAGNAEEELSSALQSGKPVLVYFHAVWCTSCKEQTPIVEELEREYEGRVIFLEIDADEYPGLLKNYNPFGYLPTIVIFDNKGAEEQTYIGVVEKEELEKVISNILP